MRILLATLLALLSACSGSAADTPKSDEEVIFLPTLGRLADDGQSWTIDIHAWVFEPELLGDFNRPLRAMLGLEEEIEDDTLFQQRARWFTVDNERGKKFEIQLGKNRYQLNKSAPNGHSLTALTLPSKDIEKLSQTGKRVSFQAITRRSDSRQFGGEVLLLDDTGISVISDIDDTIKISDVRDKKALMANTFLKPFRAAPGMAKLYQDWAASEDSAFHYLTSSPWQLYVPLSDFMQQAGFPSGSFHMKYFRWRDSSFFNLFEGGHTHKTGVIEDLLARYPQRRFILVGDSGEHDPEIYGAITRRFPARIERIFIRKVSDDEADRFVEAFAELPTERWQVFTSPESISYTLP